jgi:hypothetical protein
MDAPPKDLTMPIVIIFAAALALFILPVIRLRRAKGWAQVVLLPILGIQAACCIYVVFAAFRL